MRVTIIGLGWFGLALAEKLAGDHVVRGSKTSAESAKAVSIPGVEAYPLVLNPGLISDHVDHLAEADCLVINIPPGRRDANADFYREQMEALYQAFAKSDIAHLIFVSSTGVFGETQLVTDEDTLPEPTSLSGKILLGAENFWIDNFPGRVSIIRPGGLVGGNRRPARFLSGKIDVAGKNHPVNLVHRIDLVNLTTYLIENKVNRTIFHAIADGHPRKQEYYTRAAQKTDLLVPIFNESDNSHGRKTEALKTKSFTGLNFQYNDPYDMF